MKFVLLNRICTPTFATTMITMTAMAATTATITIMTTITHLPGVPLLACELDVIRFRGDPGTGSA